MGFVEEKTEEKTKKSDGKNEDQKVPFYKLFTFADQLDVCLMIGGTLGAIGNGLAQPMMTIIFGQLINSFGTADPSHAVDQVSKVLRSTYPKFPFFFSLPLIFVCLSVTCIWDVFFLDHKLSFMVYQTKICTVNHVNDRLV